VSCALPIQLINICSSDGQRLYDAVAVSCLLVGGALLGIVGLSYTTFFLGPTALVGSAIFVFFYPTMVRHDSVFFVFSVMSRLSLSL